MNEMKQLANEYKSVEIPEELEFIVRQTVARRGKALKRIRGLKKTAVGAAAALVLFVGTVNVSPGVANAMSEVPVLGTLVGLVTVRTLSYEDGHREAEVQVPQVEGLGNKELQDALNEKYLEQNTKLYEDFMKEIGDSELTQANLALYTDYKIKYQTADFMVVQGTKLEIAASGAESVAYDNIDLKNQMIVSLPSLFKDDSYIDIISKNILEQMKEKTNPDEGIMFFLAENGDIDGFEKIKADQSFYINEAGKLVISFDEYEVAPGFMGVVEFEIPTEVVQDILVSNTYVK
ncbi:MAG TPA: DUF3298 and DUF4163 domain-containing protein [Clostridiales bacterium]|nr:DUF3298 and DUF4163 domain-containing protein [Clostridiales bacterium]